VGKDASKCEIPPSEQVATSATEPWVIAYGIIGMVTWSNRWFHPDKSAVRAEEIGAACAETLLQGSD
jgi:hypothetical protein